MPVGYTMPRTSADKWKEWLARRAAAVADEAWTELLLEHIPRLAEGLRASGARRTTVGPLNGNLFAALALPPRAIRAVVLGPRADERADGLAFSYEGDAPKEARDFARALALEAPWAVAGGSGPLRNWAAQGVLLLPRALTGSRKREAHDFWAGFVAAVVQRVAEEGRALFVMSRPPRTMLNMLASDPNRAVIVIPRGGSFFGAGCFEALAARGVDLRVRPPLLELYTDGARPGENRRGAAGLAGAGWVMLAGPGAAACEGPQPAKAARVRQLPVPGAQTNQRAELEAMRSALEFAAATVWERAVIVTDSKYAQQLALGNWTPKTNLNLVAATQAAYARAAAVGPVDIVQIRGHGRAANATPRQRGGNDQADEAASRAARGDYGGEP